MGRWYKSIGILSIFCMVLLEVCPYFSYGFCVQEEPSQDEYHEAYRKFGYKEGGNGDFTLEDAYITEYLLKMKETEFKDCISKEERKLLKSGKGRYKITHVGNGMYVFDKITGKIEIVTPGGVRELKERK